MKHPFNCAVLSLAGLLIYFAAFANAYLVDEEADHRVLPQDDPKPNGAIIGGVIGVLGLFMVVGVTILAPTSDFSLKTILSKSLIWFLILTALLGTFRLITNRVTVDLGMNLSVHVGPVTPVDEKMASMKVKANLVQSAGLSHDLGGGERLGEGKLAQEATGSTDDQMEYQQPREELPGQSVAGSMDNQMAYSQFDEAELAQSAARSTDDKAKKVYKKKYASYSKERVDELAFAFLMTGMVVVAVVLFLPWVL